MLELEWNENEEPSYIENMSQAMDNLCSLLGMDTREFSPEEFFNSVYTYIDKNDRLLYTVISNHIFELDEDGFTKWQTNLDSIVRYMYCEQFKIDFAKLDKKSKKTAVCERTKRTILKMWDHVNLARKQYIMFTHKDDDYSRIVDQKMEIKEAKIAKDMNTQMISLISIFTALSFLVFGGISSLDNIFTGAKDIPILKLIIVGDIWSFCIMNLVFTFIYFIGKITGLSICSTDDVNANIVKKYPLVCWCNFVIVVIFLVALWLYYVRRYGYSKEIDSIISKNPTCYTGAGILLILLATCLIGYSLYKSWKK